MKHKKLISYICLILLLLLIFFLYTKQKNNFEKNIDSLYNNAFVYSDDNAEFILKERGYIIRDVNNENISKKEILALFKVNSLLKNEYLHYEVFNKDSLMLSGLLYPYNDYYSSELILTNLGEFEKDININILDENKEKLLSFELKEVVVD